MSDKDSSDGRPAKGKFGDARAKFAELLRRAERNGERIRLTRRGTPIAYIVPLEDGEKLRRYDDMTRRMEDRLAPGINPIPAQPDLLGQPSGAVPKPEFIPEMPMAEEEPPIVDHGDETERDLAIAVFKKGVIRILTETQELKRPEIRDRFKDDNYIGTALRKVIGDGK